MSCWIPVRQATLGGVGGVVQSGTFANSQLFLEARPYHEKGDFFSINPGGSWQINDLMHVDFQVNASRSHFFRDSPTYLFVTCPSAGNPAGVPRLHAARRRRDRQFQQSGGLGLPAYHLEHRHSTIRPTSSGTMAA